MEDIIMRIGLNTTTTEKSKVIHRLIHITSTPPYTDPYPGNDFASPTALNIVARMKREPARRMWAQGRLQDASRAHPHIAALYKCIFEP
ncbi:hypothetical protein DFS34DRAFT_599174 [Phlyctochytrium arcticum]|nr:hypothetical protein DFS34DRAFT_599174 [Phlyctochytrium arcticum]